jgi:hypothetical protein
MYENHIQQQGKNLFPSLTVSIITRVTPEIFVYGSYSYLIQQIYSTRHNYILTPLWEDSKQEDYQYHRKLVPLLSALSDRNLFTDYIAWVDAGRFSHKIIDIALLRQY